MAAKLSTSLAVAELNVLNFVNPGVLIKAPGTMSTNSLGYATLGSVIMEASNSAGANPLVTDGDPVKPYQDKLKKALDGANNNKGFVQPGPTSCPTPVF